MRVSPSLCLWGSLQCVWRVSARRTCRDQKAQDKKQEREDGGSMESTTASAAPSAYTSRRKRDPRWIAGGDADADADAQVQTRARRAQLAAVGSMENDVDTVVCINARKCSYRDSVQEQVESATFNVQNVGGSDRSPGFQGSRLRWGGACSCAFLALTRQRLQV